MKAVVRNQFLGEVIEIKRGDIVSEVIIKSGDIEVTSIMSNDSIEEAELQVGDTATALVKAINVVLIK